MNNKIRFGTEKKLNPLATSIKYNPGVGNYNISGDTGNGSAKFSFGKEKRCQSSRPNTPGPGSYQQKNFIGNDGPKISISFNRPLTSSGSTRNMLPGPGAYDSNLNDKAKSPSYRFGNSERFRKNKESESIPGAGAYSPLNISQTKSPTWSMGKGMRIFRSSTDFVPGPGNYEYKNSLGEGPKVLFFYIYLSLL